MVTAIAIPIVLAYFYWLTKKEMQTNFQEWIELENIPEEAIVSGKIIEVNEYRERFYYHRYNHITVLRVNTGLKEITVKKVTPLMKGAVPLRFHEGEIVHLYGNWKQGFFSINRAIKQSEGA
ncbi:hypothetical protein G3A_09065 [Bacillus sp. 17376]|uniref:Uncharacterized protein n=1 Tax=Mesobacillus boroniphilus JCM 21738 TaxID=1294265 RepID=W4RN99_9BACI|nr:hypothetical protein [Mesobacillus boroniphilus]ESU32894.1 hypothetical protein G3A_09065 [Bacillus sp. 17376]GAE45900.1 hypothetical protein JCM21738_2749 [Mesobacillus boroniphilus JCM 21738]